MKGNSDTVIERTSGNLFAVLGLTDAQELVRKSDELIDIRTYLRREGLSESDAMSTLCLTSDELLTLRAGRFMAFSSERVAEMHKRLAADARS